MKLSTKIISLIMSLVLMFTMATPVFAASSEPALTTRADYTNMVSEETGIPALTTTEFLAKWNAAGDFFRLMTCGKFPSPEKLNITFDEYFLATNLYIVENSGLDIIALAQSLPALSTIPELIAKKTQIDTKAFRESMYTLREKYDAEGNGTLALLCHFLGCFMSIIDKCHIYSIPTEETNVYELYLDLTYRDGAVESLGTGLLINKVSGEVYGKAGNGILGIGFNFNINEIMVYAVINAWMRNMGYAVIYDTVANALPIWDIPTRRYHFDYKGLEWMIQSWKGTYILISNGAEVGVYNRVPGEELGTFYNCATDDQLMTMTMKLSFKDTVLLDLGPEKHWWINGFKMTGTTYPPESLTLEFSVEMPDMEMVNAFTQAVENEEHHDSTYSVKGTTVTVVW